MNEIKRVQLSFFGNFEKIKYTPEVVTELLPRLGERFMPAIFPANVIDPGTNKITVENRVHFLGIGNEENILLQPDRLDYNYTPAQNAPVADLAGIVANAAECLAKIIGYYQLVGNRLAVNGYITVDETVPRLFESNIVPKPGFGPDTEGEWDLTRNKIQAIDINGKNEKVNCLLKIEGKCPAPANAKPSASFDINTMFENSLSRFQTRDMKYFANEAVKIIEELFQLYLSGGENGRQ